MVFPVVMYECESRTIKKVEHWRIDPFELWCWRRFLRVPWTARKCNQSILKEISPGCSLEGLMLKPSWNSNTLATWCQKLTHLKRPWSWEDWGEEEKGTTEDEMVGWHHLLSGRGFGWTLGVHDGQESLACCGSLGHKESDMTEWLNWTDLHIFLIYYTCVCKLVSQSCLTLCDPMDCSPLSSFVHGILQVRII